MVNHIAKGPTLIKPPPVYFVVLNRIIDIKTAFLWNYSYLGMFFDQLKN